MPPRNHKQWLSKPPVEYISSECYNNNDIFKMEQEEIFSKVWIPMLLHIIQGNLVREHFSIMGLSYHLVNYFLVMKPLVRNYTVK
jgi:hypothetical protein